MNSVSSPPIASTSSDFYLPERRFQRPQTEQAVLDAVPAQEDSVSISSAQPQQREAVRNFDAALALVGALTSGILQQNASAFNAHSNNDRSGLAELLAQ